MFFAQKNCIKNIFIKTVLKHLDVENTVLYRLNSYIDLFNRKTFLSYLRINFQLRCTLKLIKISPSVCCPALFIHKLAEMGKLIDNVLLKKGHLEIKNLSKGLFFQKQILRQSVQSGTTLQTLHVYSTLKRHGNVRFHFVSTWIHVECLLGSCQC